MGSPSFVQLSLFRLRQEIGDEGHKGSALNNIECILHSKPFKKQQSQIDDRTKNLLRNRLASQLYGYSN